MECTRRSGKVKPCREFDIVFDTTLTYPSSRDYQREMQRAVAITSTFMVRPNFDTMFSDIRPRCSYEVKFPDISTHAQDSTVSNYAYVPHYRRMSAVLGSQRPLYFKQPHAGPKPAPLNIKLDPAPLSELSTEIKSVSTASKACHKEVQTDYRESETQTEIWAHDVVASENLALLRLGWLDVDKPIGEIEIAMLKRHWQKEAWDSILPDMDLLGKGKKMALTSAMAANDTANCEDVLEVDNIHRLAASAKNIAANLANQRRLLNERLQRFSALLKENKAETVAYLKHQLQRNLRKLSMKHRGVQLQYKSRLSRNALAELMDKSSMVHAPQLRFGDTMNSNYEQPLVSCRQLYQLRGIEIVEGAVSDRPPTTGLRCAQPKKEICRRMLAQREQEFKLLAEQPDKGLNNRPLIFRQQRDTLYSETPGLEEDEGIIEKEWAEDRELNRSILGRVVRGRAAQKELFEKMKKLTADFEGKL